MADDKKKKEGDKEGKKKGLPPIVLVAIGAALGGAGMVVMSPTPAPVESQHLPIVPVKVLTEVDKTVEHSFNPNTDRGKSMASVSFRFNYVTLEPDSAAAEEAVKHNWDRMSSSVLLLLSAQTPEQIKSTKNSLHLEKQLREAMTLSLFPPQEGEKTGIAVVKEILWRKKFVQ